MSSTVLNKCLVCDNDQLIEYLDLGDQQPLANTYLDKPTDLPTYELKVNFCRNCKHSQLSQAVEPDLLYKDYKYVSGTTQTLKDHFKELVSSSVLLLKDANPASVLDIGCNDCSLLEEFESQFWCKTVGVDPAENLAYIAVEKQIHSYTEYWTEEFSNHVLRHNGKQDIICVLNCLAHNSNPKDFLRGCKNVLADDGRLIVEFPYFGNTLKIQDFGQIYAEHHSYFSLYSFGVLCDKTGLIIDDIKFLPEIHGGTMRFIIKHQVGHTPHCFEYYKCLDVENQYGIEENLKLMSSRLKVQVNRLIETINLCKSNGLRICSYSASAKSSTLFNLPEMKEIVKDIDFVVDDNPLKIGKFCPGSNLGIKDPKCLADVDRLVVLINAHNFKKEIIQRLKSLGLEQITILNHTPSVYLEYIV